MAKIIHISGLKKRFGANIVLDGIDLDFEAKKVTAIIGQSGTGKSVLLKTVNGILQADEGSIALDGKPMEAMEEKELLEARRRFGYLFQNAALFDSMTVEQNIAFPLREMLGIKDRKKIRERVREMLSWVDLEGIEKKFPAELSGGMRKRVGFARTLAPEPDILLFDEPTTGLDPVLSESINELISRVNRELGMTCIVISHDIAGMFAYADTIAFLADGKIAAKGKPGELARSNHPVLRKFLEYSFTNFDAYEDNQCRDS
ncbi:ABC transporter ATP-binding protein [Sediminispirochaeta smaragdinae]|jgi:phospholipid/cholesterol/gamma-HCH transport system ATP-binding protein|uniref:ABC transporter related protein n=1 Tax=Sediminispirochaeta smaragdinae (strain DSM 11293 / JCM 15392 / SEBR 4228) TaxID=573413 RepID=E1R9E5_SEDSS|nr:ATP-binding cassette domain-containing protein [Sediminispirochaeta smaragdinae]ADK83114.1 ABC transporter related protein [Sediminispirochaeta smaragdinae DSM 11293]